MAGQAAMHIVMVPFLAQGHLTPFLALAELMAQRNPSCTVTLATTPLNIASLGSPSAAVRLHALPFRAADHGLDSENTDSLPTSRILGLALASESLERPFDRLVSDLALRPDTGTTRLCVVADLFCGWAGRVARRHALPHATFTTCGGYGTAFFASLWLHMPHLRSPQQLEEEEDRIRIPGFPDGITLHRSQMSSFMRAAAESDPGVRFFRRQIALAFESDALLCNTVEALEPAGVQLLRNFTGLELYAVGPLLPLEKRPSYRRRRGGRSPGIEPEACTQWLSTQRPGSVVYVSFGSQNSIAAAPMMALAEGLELSGRPFIWVVRPPVGFDLNGSFREEEWLPEGFEARTRTRGLVVRSWAPQLEILSHESTGVFLSHCGWNSVLESLSRGVPMLGWPLAGEQFYNVKMLEEELGVAVEVARGVESVVRSSDIAGAIELALGGDRGRLMKDRAVAAASTIGDAMREGDGRRGSSVKAIDEFLERAMSGRLRDG